MALATPPQIIIRPYQTEASTQLADKSNQYTFVVSPTANKIEIKKAVEKQFKVKVLAVNTIMVKGKWRRVRGKLGKKVDRKKAIVTVKSGDKIEYI
ncbi:MAG: 50S ribosomal protein L23 [bacterium]|nr:50S ribosomal protein L23 [bacterium]